MSSNAGTVKVNITWSEGQGFIFQETHNDTGGAVVFKAGKRKFEVLEAGSYQFFFSPTNFTLADPPIGYPDGKPSFLSLDPGHTPTAFSMSNVNSGLVPNETGRFLVHRAGEGEEDPTVVNNPNPSPPDPPDDDEGDEDGWPDRG
jgi:hypothetical protein